MCTPPLPGISHARGHTPPDPMGPRLDRVRLPVPAPGAPFAGAYTAFAQVFPELRIQHRRAAHPHEGWVRTPGCSPIRPCGPG